MPGEIHRVRILVSHGRCYIEILHDAKDDGSINDARRVDDTRIRRRTARDRCM